MGHIPQMHTLKSASAVGKSVVLGRKEGRWKCISNQGRTPKGSVFQYSQLPPPVAWHEGGGRHSAAGVCSCGTVVGWIPRGSFLCIAACATAASDIPHTAAACAATVMTHCTMWSAAQCTVYSEQRAVSSVQCTNNLFQLPPIRLLYVTSSEQKLYSNFHLLDYCTCPLMSSCLLQLNYAVMLQCTAYSIQRISAQA